MRSSSRKILGVLTAASILIGMGPVAMADNVVNNIAVGGNDTFAAGGSTVVGYAIHATGGDSTDPKSGQANCNPVVQSVVVTINVPAGVTASPSALTFSNCETPQNVTFSSNNPGNYAISASTNAADEKDYNENGATFTLKVVAPSNTAPVLSLPADISAEATGPGGAAVTYSASATDAEDNPDPVPTCSPASGATFPLGSTTVNCSVTDSKGLNATGTFKVTVVDTTSPTVTPASNMTVEATGASGATVTYSGQSASDLVDGSIIPTCTPSSGSTFALGNNVVSCSATDSANNTGSATFTIKITDTTKPVLLLPAPVVEATGPSGAEVTYTASASDLVDGSVAPSCSPVSGTTFALGNTTVNCTAADAAGNAAMGSFIVSVVDTTPPAVTVPGNVTAEATSGAGASVSYSVESAVDLVDGSIAPACSSASGSTFPLGATTVTCSATDAAGNTGSNTFTVTVVDKTPPAVTVPGNVTAEATSGAGASVPYSVESAVDLVDGSIAPACSSASGSTFPLGVTTVTCSATDAAGNTGSNTFTVTVVDTTAPALILPANISVSATSGSSAVVTYAASANDLVDGAVAVTCVPPSGSAFGAGSNTVECSATDARGNTRRGSFIVTVNYRWLGFFQPVDNLPALNKVKSGSAIPVKFSLGGDQGLSIFAGGYPKSVGINCTATSAADAIEQTVTAGGSSLSYDPVANQYVYVWKTDKAWAGTCRQLQVKLADGSLQVANFNFTK